MEIIGESPRFTYPIIYVRTEENSIFSYTCGYKNLCRWEKLEQLPDEKEDEHSCVLDSPPFLVPPFFFGKVLSEHENSLGCFEIEFQYKFIVTEGGTVWEWTREFSSYAIIIIFPAWIIMALGAGIVGYIKLFPKKNKDT